MGRAGHSCSLRGRARAQTLRGVGASEGFAPGRVVWICALWALIHGVLASKQVKDLTRRIAGPRYRDGLYRFTFNAQSVVLLLWAARRFSRLPDRELYRVVVSISRSNPCNAGASSRARRDGRLATQSRLSGRKPPGRGRGPGGIGPGLCRLPSRFDSH
jgi:hypothetical protein